VDGLCHPLAAEIGEAGFDPRNVQSIFTLLDYCQSLIVADAEALSVQLIHCMVKELSKSLPQILLCPRGNLLNLSELTTS